MCIKMIKLYENDLPENVITGDSVAIDTETLGLNIFSDRLCLVQISTGDGTAHIVKFSDENRYAKAKNLIKLLEDESIEKIFHFARFDICILNKSFGINIKNVYCTKIASKLARTYTDRHGLKELCRELIGIEISKHEQTSYWGDTDLRQEQLKYAANDVLYLHRIKEKLNYMLVREGRLDICKECFLTLEKVVVPFDLSNKNFSNFFEH